MTRLPDGPRNPVFFKLFTPLLAAMVTLGVFASPAQAIERAPADYAGDFVTSCKDYHKKGFLDVGLGNCWRCPSATPSRSMTSVKSKSACFKAAHRKHSKATIYGKAKGALKTKCKKGKLDVRTGKCFKCPSGHIRTARKVTSKKACVGAVKKKSASAISLGDHGCPAGSWRHGLTSKCYTCPKGSIRNARIGNPGDIDACTFTNISDATNKARILAAAPAASKHSEEKRSTMSLNLADIINDENEKRDDPNAYRREKMHDLLDQQIEEDEGFKVVTLMGGANISFGGGYGHMRGFAMGQNKDDERVCREVFSNTATAGVSAGAGGGMEMGVWRVTMEDVAGETNGVQGGISLLLGVSSGIHWAPDGKWTKPSDYVGLTVMNGITNSGTGSGASGGAGLEAGIEYVHGWTKARCTVPCDELDWDDIPLLDSNSSCKGES